MEWPAKLAAAATLAVLLAVTATAHAVTLYASSATEVVRGAPPWTATYLLELDAGPTSEEVGLSGPGMRVVGGPAKVLETFGTAQDILADRCDLHPVLRWGADLENTVFRLELPPESVTFVSVTRWRDWYPLVGEDLAYTFDVWLSKPDGGEWLHAPVPGPQVALPHRPPITLTSPDAPKFGADISSRVVRLRGTAPLELAGQLIALSYTRDVPARGPAKRIARVPVDRDGSFGYVWHVPWRGTYRVSARYRSQDARFASAWSQCGVGFSLR